MTECVRTAYGEPHCVDWCREPRDCCARPLVSELLFQSIETKEKQNERPGPNRLSAAT